MVAAGTCTPLEQTMLRPLLWFSEGGAVFLPKQVAVAGVLERVGTLRQSVPSLLTDFLLSRVFSLMGLIPYL